MHASTALRTRQMGRRLMVLAWCVSALAGAPSVASAQARESIIQVSLVSGTPEEQRARDQLLRILSTWDLSRWLFTHEARIDARAIPHSHPVLTVNTRYLANDTAQAATFVHEQLHWFLARHRSATDAAIAELEHVFPGAPQGPPEGARDRYSTYLHLLVCLLEYDALSVLFDEGVARRTLEGWRHYPWVYEQVLERPQMIRPVLVRHGLGSPDARRVGPARGSPRGERRNDTLRLGSRDDRGAAVSLPAARPLYGPRRP